MATLALGGLFASSALFKYNRKNFMFDKRMRQEREFQEQDMRVEQFVLYREDVRDLVELTVAKMDLYLIAAALLADRLTVMICTQNEALPPKSPEWVVALNSMSLASGMFYLLLCLWLAMYASVSAQAYGARLLTQLVRLPYATREQIEHATSSGVNFEERSVGELLRVPVVQQSGPGTRDEDDGGEEAEGAAGATSSSAGAPIADSTDPNAGFANLLPTAMLEHIRLYRRMQLNWLAYDAYARVSLFAGANSCLYCCLYWSLGQFLHNQHALLPALGVSLIFACVQVLLLRLDLRLTRRQLVVLGALLVATPALTCLGMVLHQSMLARLKVEGRPGLAWMQPLMGLCAFGSHTLHTVVVIMLLKASWPDPSSGAEAFLPGKFRSTLFLDVFGWLLNPGGPGPSTPPPEEESLAQEEVEETCRSAETSFATTTGSESNTAVTRTSTRRISAPMVRRSRMASWGPSTEVRQTRSTPDISRRDSVRRLSQRVDLSPELRREASRLLSPQTGRRAFRRSLTQETRFGGREAQPLEVMELVNEPAPDNTTDFTTLPSPSPAASQKAHLPGERPWRSFRVGSRVILTLWFVNTAWAFGKLVDGKGWPLEEPERLEALALPDAEEEPALGPVLRAACVAAEAAAAAAALRLASAGRAEAAAPPWGAGGPGCPSPRRPPRPPAALADRGCGLRRPVAAAALACREAGDLPAGRCLAALLRRGGREVSLCRARRGPGGLGLERAATLRLAPGAPSLRHLAAGWRGRRSAVLPANDSNIPSDLLLFARTQRGGALLALHPSTSSSSGSRGQLIPEFEIEPAAAAAGEGLLDDARTGGRLAVVGEALLSLEPGGPAAAAAGSCPAAAAAAAAAAPRLAAWDLARGGREELRLAAWDSACEEPAEALRQLCAARGPHKGADTEAEFLRPRPVRAAVATA